MTKYRIRPVAPNKYVVEKKILFFWVAFLKWPWHVAFDTCVRKFESIENAEIALKIELDDRNQIKRHLSQPCKVITHDS